MTGKTAEAIYKELKGKYGKKSFKPDTGSPTSPTFSEDEELPKRGTVRERISALESSIPPTSPSFVPSFSRRNSGLDTAICPLSPANEATPLYRGTRTGSMVTRPERTSQAGYFDRAPVAEGTVDTLTGGALTESPIQE